MNDCFALELHCSGCGDIRGLVAEEPVFARRCPSCRRWCACACLGTGATARPLPYFEIVSATTRVNRRVQRMREARKMFQQDEVAVQRAAEQERQQKTLRDCLASGTATTTSGVTSSFSSARAEDQERTFKPGVRVTLKTDPDVPAGTLRFVGQSEALVEWPSGSSSLHNHAELKVVSDR